MNKEITCICCPIGCVMQVNVTRDEISVAGNKCPRGKAYAIEEVTSPKRFLTTTVAIENWIYPVIPVKTAKPIPKDKIFEAMDLLSDIMIKGPKKVGDVVLKDVLDTGIDVIVTRNTSV